MAENTEFNNNEQERLQADEMTETVPECITMSKDEFEQVKQHIEKLQGEYDKTVVLAQRIQADFDNFRRRNAAVRVDSLQEGTRNVIKELLPVLDNFDRAMDNCNTADASWLSGMQLVQRQLLDILAKAGLEEIPAEGKFDPELHNAVLQEETEGLESGTISEVLLKGYKVKDCIIRHSMVKVAK